MGNVLGIICEYNPFHNGHMYHLLKSKEVSGAKYSIAVMSGSFVQRGEPALIDKWSRAEMAIKGGVDLVIELPAIYANSSASDFSYGAIKILKELKIVDVISFGSMSGDIQKLETLADLFLNEPDELIQHLDEALLSGMSYPKALSQATMLYLKSKEYSEILDDANNVLGIEYIKEIKRQKFPVTAMTIQRNGEGHNSKKLSSFASGTRIREGILNGENISDAVPEHTNSILKENINNLNVIGLEPYEQILFYKIRNMDLASIKNIYDVNEGLEHRIKKASYISKDINDLISNIKSKRYTESKIRRILVSILLDITKKDMQIAKNSKPYVRILGFNQNGKQLISSIAKANPKIDIIISVASFEKNNLNKDIEKIFNKDILSTDLLALSSSPILPAKLDYTKKIINEDF